MRARRIAPQMTWQSIYGPKKSVSLVSLFALVSFSRSKAEGHIVRYDDYRLNYLTRP